MPSISLIRARPLAVLGLAIALAFALGAASCPSPTATSSSAAFAMRVGTSNELPGGGASTTLYRVDNDSRCPVDVTCVSAGNAVVVFGVSTCMGCLPAQQFLNTNIEPHSLGIAGFRIRLDSLLPAPHSGRVIAQSDYAAYVTVTRLGGT